MTLTDSRGTRIHPLAPDPRPSAGRVGRARTLPTSLLLALALAAWTGHPAQAQDPGMNRRSNQAPLEGIGDAPAPGQRVVLVTGSTGGLGREVARSLAASGAHVIVHGRNQERGLALVQEIRDDGAGSARFYRADFGSLAQVRALGAAVLRDYDRLDALVNNAGIAFFGDPERPISADGLELHFQVNYLAGYVLTEMLLPLLEASAPSRIVNVSSLAQAPLDFQNLMLDEGYDYGRAYSQSKLAQILYTFDLAERLAGVDVKVNALHPSTFMDTDMVMEAGIEPRSSVMTGRDAVLVLLNDPEVGSGGYYNVFEPARANDQAYDPAARTRLMEVSRRFAGGG